MFQVRTSRRVDVSASELWERIGDSTASRHGTPHLPARDPVTTRGSHADAGLGGELVETLLAVGRCYYSYRVDKVGSCTGT
jgi:hypothetical protein